MYIRPINSSKYKITENRFKELYYFCLQYDEWIDELKYKKDTMRSPEVKLAPGSLGVGMPTQELAIRREMLEHNCNIIRQAAVDADKELSGYILKAVTHKDITYNYLYSIMGIPCSRNTYYDRRRKFYWILSNLK